MGTIQQGGSITLRIDTGSEKPPCWSRSFGTSLYFQRSAKGIDESRYTNLGGCALASGPGLGTTSLLPCIDTSDPELVVIVRELHEQFLVEAARRGYVIGACSGFEARVKALHEWRPEYYNYVLNLKKMLDPNNIMNPGVFFP